MMRTYSNFTTTYTITHTRTDTGDTGGQRSEWPRVADVYDYQGLYNLLACVYRQAIKDARGRGRVAAEATEWLDENANDEDVNWRWLVNKHTGRPFEQNKKRAGRTVRRTCTVSITIAETIEFDQEEPS